MALCVSQLPFGKLSSRYSIRSIYTGAMFIFLVGSTSCGAAPNSPALIAGRAIAGLGSSGLLIATYSLIPMLAPPKKRALSLSLISMARSVAATVGPLVGGALTLGASWRWTFYINLPLGAVIYATFIFSITPQKRAGETSASFPDFLQTLDLIGLAVLIPCVVCLLLALQWGGINYPWSDGRIITLLVVCCVREFNSSSLSSGRARRRCCPRASSPRNPSPMRHFMAFVQVEPFTCSPTTSQSK